MKYFLLLIFLFLLNNIYSQNEIDNRSNNGFFVKNYLGFVVTESENQFKTNLLVYGASLGKEFNLDGTFSLLPSIDFFRTFGNTSNFNEENLYLTNNYLNIPLLIRASTQAESKASLFADLGVYVGYLSKSNIENLSNNEIDKISNLGFNLGIQAAFGFQYNLNNDISFDLSMLLRDEFLRNYKNTIYGEFNLSNFYALQIGFGFKI